jgi:aminoglycoside 3-N-acetyltransferase
MENSPALVTRGQMARDLRALGIAPGQVILLHASVKAVGWVVGGPDVVLQALLDVLTSDGTLCMYVSWEEWEQGLVDYAGWPEARQAAYREECPPFDPHTSRANRKWSILTEYLRTWPGALRSDHPTASVAAVGAQAQWITSDHPLDYGYGRGSPWDKVCQLGGKVLLLGAPLTDMTLLHYAEHIARVADKRVTRNQVPLLREGRREWVTFEEFDTCDGIREWPGGNVFGQIAGQYLASGHGLRGPVGGAQCSLFDAAHLADFAVAWMEQTWKE